MTALGGDASQDTAWLETLPIGVAVFGPTHRLHVVNPRFFALLGLAPDRQPLDGLDDLLAALTAGATPEGHQGATLLAAQFAPRGEAGDPQRWQRADGRAIDIASTAMPNGGRTLTLVDAGSAAAQRQARDQAGTLRAVLDAIPYGVCVFSPDRRVTLFNRGYTQTMAGAPLAVGERMDDIIRRRTEAGEFGPGAPDEIVRQQMAFDIGRPQARRRRRPNGTVIDIRTAPLPDGGHISVVSDITALNEAEAEATRRAEEMAAMLASIRHGILLWGPDRRLIASNAIAAELLNHPTGMLTPGRTQEELLDSMQQRGELGAGDPGREAIRTLRERDRSTPYVRQTTTRSGRVLEVRSDPTPAGGWVTTFADVTEARRAEQEARRAKEAAEAANQAKSHFLATMSHELRTPLNAVIGFSDAMLRESDNPAAARVAEFARQINESGRNLLGLINIILDVASIESGRFELALEPVQVPRLVRNAVRAADAAAQAAEICLVADLPEALPKLRGDERRLMQVLNHLLSNAIKFTEAGGTITVGARREADGGLLVFVRDTGMGIEAENLERVFEPFTQLDATLARRFHGAGLGLYLSRALIAGHAGRLTLQSQVGQGTTAEIRLPAGTLVPGREGT